MKVLMLNGSPHAEGCTKTALRIVGEELRQFGIDYEIVDSGTGAVRDCIACGGCRKAGHCVLPEDPAVNAFVEKAKEADGFVFGSPVYYAHPSGRILSLLDRIFFSSGKQFYGKPGATVASARRAGTTATLDVLNKYLSISGMPVVGSTYWNMVHGSQSEDVTKDEEGVQTLKNLARNMAYLLQCMDCAQKNGITPPERLRGSRTNFIR